MGLYMIGTRDMELNRKISQSIISMWDITADQKRNFQERTFVLIVKIPFISTVGLIH